MTNRPNPLEALLAALAGVPALPGARCRGRGHLFDPSGDREPADVVAARQTQAAELCAHCPALERCAGWLFDTPRERWPRGVVAGYTIAGPARKPTITRWPNDFHPTREDTA